MMCLSPLYALQSFPATTHPQLHTLSLTDLQLAIFHHPPNHISAPRSFRINAISPITDEEKKEELQRLHCLA